MNSTDVKELWSQYQKCDDVMRQMGINADTEQAYRFFEGDQWYGLESGGEQMPVYNFISPIVKYKTSMVAMNNIAINYSAPTASEYVSKACAMLSKLALAKWERLKMDSKCWDIVKSAMIAGDSYAYFYNGDGDCQVIDRTDIMFADETEPDISKQSYIFIKERLAVGQIKEQAKKNDIKNFEDIVDDGEGDGKCTGVLKLELKEGDLYYTRFTKNVIYQPTKVIKNLGVYPVASFISSPKRSSARGVGEVLPVVPNQIEVNRNLARRLLNAKLTAYSRLVYAADRITNPKTLTEVGTAIEVDGGGVSSIKDAITYLTPSSMSPDAKMLSDELLTVSKELAGAGDAALGNIDPTQASGSAIIAVRDQSALPLNEQTARFKQFCEEVAKIWYRLWAVYGADGIELEGGQTISGALLLKYEPDIRVDISNTSPFSKYAREQAIERLFTMGQVTFEEYVELLDDDSSVPKAKLEHIIKQRGGIKDGDYQNK